MSDPTTPTPQTQRPIYEYKAVAYTGNPSTDNFKALLDPEGAQGWLVVAIGGSFFIMVRQTNLSINTDAQQPGQQPYPTPPYYYGR